jgi:hypothetical protein
MESNYYSWRTYDISDEIYNQIVEDYEADIVELASVPTNWKNVDRNYVYVIKGTDYILCREYIVAYYCQKYKFDKNDWWKLVLLRRNENTNITIEKSVTGIYAWNIIMKVLRKYYSDFEIIAILRSFKDTENTIDKQYHYNWPNESQNVQKLPLCVKYDINGAHTDALCEMFPKASKDFIRMYKKRHTDIKYKKLTNFFVGMLKHKGYDKAYWHIVGRTSKILFNAMDKVGGTLVYANTDGFCVMNPKNKLEVSDKLGDFKLEYSGTVYVFNNNKRQSPYILYQFGDELKGNCMTEVRKYIDLSKNKVVYYDRVRHEYCMKAENIVKEQLNG